MSKNTLIPCGQSIRIIRRYANLHEKETHRFQIMNFLNAVKRDIKAGKINPAGASTVVLIKSELQKVYDKSKGYDVIFIEIENIDKYEKIAKENLGFIPEMISAAIAEGARKLSHKHLFNNPLGTTKKNDFTKEELNGILKKPKSKKKSLGDIDAPTENKSVEKIENGLPAHFIRADNRTVVKSPDSFRLPGELGNFLQDIQPFKYSIVLTGDPHAGKTELVTQIINAFCAIKKRVGWWSIEQGGMESKNTKEAIDRNITKENQKYLSVTGEAKNGINTIKEEAKFFDVIVIDSFQKLGVPSTQFDSLRHQFPNKIWVVIFQQNGAGGTRGGVSADYDSPVLIKVHRVDETFKNNYAELLKNRGNQLGLQYLVKAKKTKPLTD